MLCLDAMRKVIGCVELSRGIVNSAEISIRRMVEIALARNASGVVMAHNHTNGIALPSAEDEITTLRVRDALMVVGIELIDHIVVADGDFVSMRASGLLST